MKPTARRQVLLGTALLGVAGLAAVARPPRPVRKPGLQQALEQAMPVRVGEDQRGAAGGGLVLPPQDALSQAIYDGYVARAYAAPGLAPIYLVIAYGSVQDYALQLHRPEHCYPASGYTIGTVRERQLALAGRQIPGSAMSARLGRHNESVLWWTRVGTAFPASLWQERRVILGSALRREVPDGVLVRFSTTDVPGAGDRLAGFASRFVAVLDRQTRALLIGYPA